MSKPQKLPDEWPVERDLEELESKLGPYEDHDDWQQKLGEERADRLGEDGERLVETLSLVRVFLEDYDMRPDEAVACLEHEISRYRGSVDSVECDICNNDVPQGSTLQDIQQHFEDVPGLDVMCYNCVIQLVGANISTDTLRRFVER